MLVSCQVDVDLNVIEKQIQINNEHIEEVIDKFAFVVQETGNREPDVAFLNKFKEFHDLKSELVSHVEISKPLCDKQIQQCLIYVDSVRLWSEGLYGKEYLFAQIENADQMLNEFDESKIESALILLQLSILELEFYNKLNSMYAMDL